jgi:hypothetical protein
MPSHLPGAQGCLAQATAPRHHVARVPALAGGSLGQRAAFACTVLLLALSLAPIRALAGSVTLTWDPVVSPVLAGYTLHYGPAPGYYPASLAIGNATTATVSSLPEGAILHFAVTAHDPSGVSSGYSNDLALIVTSGAPIDVTTIDVVEYYHAEFDHYFITGAPEEIAELDAGSFAGWTRTGYGFRALAPGSSVGSDVCRFFGTSFGERSSHFYTPLASECETVKANPDWQFEGLVFRALVPGSDGTCAAGAVPIYRLYNDGAGGAPNHRYTPDLGLRDLMLGQRWISEGYGPLGVGMCAPP